VVEEPSTVGVVERSTDFRGHYHVLGGRLSPLDGIGPDALRLDHLVDRVRAGGVREVILATNPSMEGEVTATYIQQLLAGMDVRVTRLARGLPMGGDLEYVDGVTLAHWWPGRIFADEIPHLVVRRRHAGGGYRGMAPGSAAVQLPSP
jgi:recombination protein RecR